jgi:phytoene dehydrogenase-like protein
MSKSFDAIVIGSGLGGLTAGALFARGGAKVLLLERNASFGGAATTYQHGALTVEASLHETTPPHAPGGFNRKIFEALDIAADTEFVPVETLQEVRCPLIGDPFILPHGIDAVEARLVVRFPHQQRKIRAFLRQLRRSRQAIDYLSGERDGMWLMAHAVELPLDLWAVYRDLRSSLSDVLARHFGDDEAIKFALAGNLPYFTDDPDRFWWLGFVVIQGSYLLGGGAYIKGGSQMLSNCLAEVIREEGGETLSGCEAVAIELGPNGEAAGVRYRSVKEGAESIALAPLIFANAAPPVIEGLLPAGQREAFMEPFRGRPLSISLCSATFGLNTKPSAFGITSYSTLVIPEWMKRLSDFKDNAALLGEMPGDRLPALAVVDYSQIDSGLAQSGVFPLNLVCADRLDNWQGLSDDAYRQKKDAWLGAFIDRLEAEWPGIADAIVEKTVATARTMHDHLNTPGGAVYGFELVPPEHTPKGMPMTFATAIKGLWLASAYAGFGGFAGAIASGASAARAAARDRQ